MIEKAPLVTESPDLITFMVDLYDHPGWKEVMNDYLYWDKAKYKAKEVDPSKFWSAVKKKRWIGYKYVRFGANQFSFFTTEYINRTLHYFDLHIGGNLSSNIGIAETDRNKFLISSIMEEAISSSQMEGANTTRKHAKEMIEKELKPKNRSEKMIFNNYLTIRDIAQRKHEPLTLERLLEIHALVTFDTLDNSDEEGKFRTNDDVHVVNTLDGEIAHTPPLEQDLKKLLNDFITFFNEDQKEFIHPIVKAIIIHFMIGWIHPFTDGNGRTARALFYYYLLKNGYWLMEYLSISRIIKESKAQYERAYLYSEIDGLDLGYFITYNLKSMEKAFLALKEYINRKQQEVVQAASFLRIPGVNDRMAQILKILNDDRDRILTSKEMENRFQVSNFTARTDLKQLVSLGLLEVIQVNKVKQNFIRSKEFEKRLKGFL